MISVSVEDVRSFTHMLFLEDTFDRFSCVNALFRTAFQTEINPRKDPVFWADVRSTAFGLIKGASVPEYFRVILQTDKDATAKLVEKTGFTDCPVESLVLNLTFSSGVLSLTTGVSYGGFSLDKTVEESWDAYVLRFLQSKNIKITEKAD